MKSIDLPDDIAKLLDSVAPEKRGEFLKKNGFRLPTALKKGAQLGLKSGAQAKTASQDATKIFTDGASRGNPGEAGAGFVILIQKEKFFLKEENTWEFLRTINLNGQHLSSHLQKRKL